MSAALCCCSVCCAEISTACTKLIGSRRVTQLSYVGLLLLFVIPVVLVTYILSILSKFVNLTPTSVVLRMSMTLFVLFLVMLLLMMCRNRCSQVINEGLFCVKLLCLILLFVGTLFLPQSVINIYGSVAQVCSILYLAIQAIMLVDIFYLWGIRLVKRYDNGETSCGGVLIGLTIIVETLAIFLNVLAYINFGGDQCGSTTWLSVITSIIIVLLPVVQLLGFNIQNNLFTTALVSLLISYTSYAAQQYFSSGCTVRLTPLGYAIDVVVCLLLLAITTYGTLRGGFSEHEYDQPLQPSPLQPNQPGANQSLLKKEQKAVEQTDTIGQYEQGWGWVRWHFFMCLGVMYLGMIFSNWLATDEVGRNLQGSTFVFWLKAASGWFTGIVYIWTMVAPRIFPERDFTIQ